MRSPLSILYTFYIFAVHFSSPSSLFTKCMNASTTSHQVRLLDIFVIQGGLEIGYARHLVEEVSKKINAILMIFRIHWTTDQGTACNPFRTNLGSGRSRLLRRSSGGSHICSSFNIFLRKSLILTTTQIIALSIKPRKLNPIDSRDAVTSPQRIP